MEIAIVGAGFSGLVAARTLSESGHRVTVYEQEPDLGGVWCRAHRYPGLVTQNDKGTYAFSDFPMPPEYPEWPTGAQVQHYLEGYARRFGLDPLLRLGTAVTRAVPREGGGWDLTLTRSDGIESGVTESGVTESAATGSAATESVTADHLVVANGIFNRPLVPDWPGAAEFTAAGGQVVHSSELTDLESARGRQVVVVGYGKSACDLAVALSAVSAGTTVIARHLIWKMPRRLANLLNYKYLLLTRLGEGLLPYMTLRGGDRALHAASGALPRRMTGSLQALVVRQLHLCQVGLVPPGRFTDLARSTASLVSEGFFERVRDGRIGVHRDEQVVRLLARNGRPAVELGSGEVLAADVVACGTGFRQEVPFLDPDVAARLLDDRGNFELYRYVLPHDVPDLTFAGYNSSLLSPLNAEIASVWVAAHLAGALRLPPVAERRRLVQERLRWMERRTDGKHARGTNVIPFSMHAVDELLADLGIDVGRLVRLREWLLPIDPGRYRSVAPELHRRLAVGRTGDGRTADGGSA